MLTHFFKSVKERSGVIAPQHIMTDDAEQFYNAWISAFGGTPHKLLCTWHVDRAWRGHLLSIKDEKLSQTIYHNLRVLYLRKQIRRNLKSCLNKLKYN